MRLHEKSLDVHMKIVHYRIIDYQPFCVVLESGWGLITAIMRPLITYSIARAVLYYDLHNIHIGRNLLL